MPAESPHRLQNAFLDHVMARKIPVTVFLVNGVKLQGTVLSHDSFCILLGRDGQSQAVYKQAISTITSAYPIELWEGGEKTEKPAAPPPERKVVVERRPSARKPLQPAE